MKYPTEDVEDVSLLQCWDSLVQKQFNKSQDILMEELAPFEDKELVSDDATGEDSTQPKNLSWVDKYEVLEMPPNMKKVNIPSVVKPPTIELKQLSSHLKYAFLESSEQLPVIVAAELTDTQESSL
jgi:hypothetical protein